MDAFCNGTKPSRWVSYVDSLGAVIDRFHGVLIENRPAAELFGAWDHADCVWYCDPPYVHSTRRDKNFYRHEMTDGEHVELLEGLSRLRGTVMVSGYGCDLYDRMVVGWERYTREAVSNGSHDVEGDTLRTEVLWIKRTGKNK
jgi:DNA adenine methylase